MLNQNEPKTHTKSAVYGEILHTHNKSTENPNLKNPWNKNKTPRHRTWPDQFNTFGTKRRKPEQQQQRLEWHPRRAAWEPATRAAAATSTDACWREVGSPVHQPGYRTYFANLCVTQSPIIFRFHPIIFFIFSFFCYNFCPVYKFVDIKSHRNIKQ